MSSKQPAAPQSPAPPESPVPAARRFPRAALALTIAAPAIICVVGLVMLAMWGIPVGPPARSAAPTVLPTSAPTATPTVTATPPPPTSTPTPGVPDLLAEVDAAWGLGDWPTVIRDLQKALAFEPGNPDLEGKLYVALINFGRALQSANRLSEAAAAFEAARQIVPDGPEIGPLLAALTPTPTPTATPDPKPRVAKYIVDASPLITRIPLLITEWRQQLEYGTLQLRLGDPRGLTTISMSSRAAGIELSSLNARLTAVSAPPQVLGAHNRALSALGYLMEAAVQLDRASQDNDVSKVMWADTLLTQATVEADAAIQELRRIQQSFGL